MCCLKLTTFSLWCGLLHLLPFTTSVGGRHDTFRSTSGSRKQSIQVVTIQAEPYVKLKWEPGLIGNERYHGYFVDLLSKIAEEAGFDFHMRLATTDRVGSRDVNSVWDGMLGEIQRRTADLALGPVVLTSERQTDFTFTEPVNSIHLTLVVSKPTDEKPLTVSSIYDLINQDAISYGVIRGSETSTIMETAQDGTVSMLWSSILRKSQFVENIYEGLEKVRRQNYVLVLDSATAEYYIGQQPCDLITVGDFLQGRHYAFAVKNDERMLEKINNALRKLKSDHSKWYALKNRWFTSECTGASSDLTPSRTGGGSGWQTTDIPRRGPKARSIRVTTSIDEPYVMHSPTAPYGLEGYIIDLIDRIAEAVPFRYELHLVADGKGIGRHGKQGQWSGMIGELLREDVDLAAAPFVPRRRHRRHLTFSKPFLHSTMSILMRAPLSGEDISILFMEDLLNQTRITFGVVEHSKTFKDFKAASEGIQKTIWQRMIRNKKNSILPNMNEALNRIRRGNFALILQSTESSFIASKKPCDLMSLDQFLSITHYMFALKKGNGLVEEIDRALLKLQQEGVLQMLYHKWWNSEECMGVTERYDHAHRQRNDTRDSINRGFITDLAISATTKSKPETTTLPKPHTERHIIVDKETSTQSSESMWEWWVRTTAKTFGHIYTQTTSAPFGPVNPGRRKKGRRRNRNRHRNTPSMPSSGQESSSLPTSTQSSSISSFDHRNPNLKSTTKDYDYDYGFAWMPVVTPSTTTTEKYEIVNKWWERDPNIRTPDYSVEIQTNGNVRYEVVDGIDDGMEDIFKYEGEYDGYEDYYVDNNRDFDHSDEDVAYEMNTNGNAPAHDQDDKTQDYILDQNDYYSSGTNSVSTPSTSKLDKARLLIVFLFAMFFSKPAERH